jgi:hypothetical protein
MYLEIDIRLAKHEAYSNAKYQREQIQKLSEPTGGRQLA